MDVNKKKKASKPGKPKIEHIDTSSMRNEAFFQYYTEILFLLRKEFGEESEGGQKVKELIGEFKRLYDSMDEAFKKVCKSLKTEKIKQTDKERDTAWQGMTQSCKTALKHSSPTVVDAAKRLLILFKTYGNVPRKSFQEGTAAIYNVMQELTGAYAPDVALTGIGHWATELQSKNCEFAQLMRERYDEKRAKPEIAMKSARDDVSEQYLDIVEMTNALVIVEGAARYEEFIKAVNLVIEKFETIKRHKRKTASKKNDEPDN